MAVVDILDRMDRDAVAAGREALHPDVRAAVIRDIERTQGHLKAEYDAGTLSPEHRAAYEANNFGANQNQIVEHYATDLADHHARTGSAQLPAEHLSHLSEQFTGVKPIAPLFPPAVTPPPAPPPGHGKLHATAQSFKSYGSSPEYHARVDAAHGHLQTYINEGREFVSDSHRNRAMDELIHHSGDVPAHGSEAFRDIVTPRPMEQLEPGSPRHFEALQRIEGVHELRVGTAGSEHFIDLRDLDRAKQTVARELAHLTPEQLALITPDHLNDVVAHHAHEFAGLPADMPVLKKVAVGDIVPGLAGKISETAGHAHIDLTGMSPGHITHVEQAINRRFGPMLYDDLTEVGERHTISRSGNTLTVSGANIADVHEVLHNPSYSSVTVHANRIPNATENLREALTTHVPSGTLAPHQPVVTAVPPPPPHPTVHITNYSPSDAAAKTLQHLDHVIAQENRNLPVLGRRGAFKKNNAIYQLLHGKISGDPNYDIHSSSLQGAVDVLKTKTTAELQAAFNDARHPIHGELTTALQPTATSRQAVLKELLDEHHSNGGVIHDHSPLDAARRKAKITALLEPHVSSPLGTMSHGHIQDAAHSLAALPLEQLENLTHDHPSFERLVSRRPLLYQPRPAVPPAPVLSAPVQSIEEAVGMHSWNAHENPARLQKLIQVREALHAHVGTGADFISDEHRANAVGRLVNHPGALPAHGTPEFAALIAPTGMERLGVASAEHRELLERMRTPGTVTHGNFNQASEEVAAQLAHLHETGTAEQRAALARMTPSHLQDVVAHHAHRLEGTAGAVRKLVPISQVIPNVASLVTERRGKMQIDLSAHPEHLDHVRQRLEHNFGGVTVNRGVITVKNVNSHNLNRILNGAGHGIEVDAGHLPPAANLTEALTTHVPTGPAPRGPAPAPRAPDAGRSTPPRSPAAPDAHSRGAPEVHSTPHGTPHVPPVEAGPGRLRRAMSATGGAIKSTAKVTAVLGIGTVAAGVLLTQLNKPRVRAARREENLNMNEGMPEPMEFNGGANVGVGAMNIPQVGQQAQMGGWAQSEQARGTPVMENSKGSLILR